LRRFVFIPFGINYNATGYASLPACRRGKSRIDRNQPLSKSPRLRRVIIACNRRIQPQARCVPLMGLPLRTARWKRCVPRRLSEEICRYQLIKICPPISSLSWIYCFSFSPWLTALWRRAVELAEFPETPI